MVLYYYYYILNEHIYVYLLPTKCSDVIFIMQLHSHTCISCINGEDIGHTFIKKHRKRFPTRVDSADQCLTNRLSISLTVIVLIKTHDSFVLCSFIIFMAYKTYTFCIPPPSPQKRTNKKPIKWWFCLNNVVFKFWKRCTSLLDPPSVRSW